MATTLKSPLKAKNGMTAKITGMSLGNNLVASPGQIVFSSPEKTLRANCLLVKTLPNIQAKPLRPKQRTIDSPGNRARSIKGTSRRNERERNRVRLINAYFGTLRQHVPTDKKCKKLSKVDTLKGAVDYIKHLQQLLQSCDENSNVPQNLFIPSKEGDFLQDEHVNMQRTLQYLQGQGDFSSPDSDGGSDCYVFGDLSSHTVPMNEDFPSYAWDGQLGGT